MAPVLKPAVAPFDDDFPVFRSARGISASFVILVALIADALLVILLRPDLAACARASVAHHFTHSAGLATRAPPASRAFTARPPVAPATWSFASTQGAAPEPPVVLVWDLPAVRYRPSHSPRFVFHVPTATARLSRRAPRH